MTSLLDVAVPLRTVKTKKYGDISVPGLSIEGIAHLVKSHPQLVDFFNQEETELPLQEIIDLGVGVFGDFLAAGLGYPGDEKAIQMCRTMNPEDAFDLGKAVFEESFPGGPKSFFAKVAQAAEQVQGSMESLNLQPNQEEKDKAA